MTKRKTGKHQKHAKDLKSWIKKVKKEAAVEKIIFGTCQNARHTFQPGQVKFREFIDTGLKYKAYTDLGVRDIFVLCKKEFREPLKQIIENFT